MDLEQVSGEEGTVSSEPLTVESLKDWVLSGGSWRVVDIAADHVVVDFCTCTGERMERGSSQEPAVIAYLRTAEPEP